MSIFFTTALGLAKFAPIVKRWLFGPHSETFATKVVDLAQKVTHASSPEQAIDALTNSTYLQSQFQKEILQLDTELEIAMIKDRRHARERDLAFMQAGHANKRADWMVISAAFGLIMCLLSLAFYSEVLPGEAVGIISTIAGIFGSCLKDSYSFEFGSSRGSKIKDSTVASAIERIHNENTQDFD